MALLIDTIWKNWDKYFLLFT